MARRAPGAFRELLGDCMPCSGACSTQNWPGTVSAEMSEALTFIAASLDLPAQTDKCEATLSAGTPGSLGRAGGGQEAAICGRAPLVHVQEVRASATREAANALWPP